MEKFESFLFVIAAASLTRLAIQNGRKPNIKNPYIRGAYAPGAPRLDCQLRLPADACQHAPTREACGNDDVIYFNNQL